VTLFAAVGSPEQAVSWTPRSRRQPGLLDALTSQKMTHEKEEQERTDRNHERSEEARWQVAEAGAEDEEQLSDAARRSDKERDEAP